ncbi:MAG: response regulator transcription factor [Chloroflexota bacterium]|nr:response regulator transcription factor [Chloroflexota bacterium]
MKDSCTFSQHSGKVIIVHPYTLLREGIIRILQEKGFQVIGQTDDIDQLHQLIRHSNPDIILIDWELMEVHWEAIRQIVANRKQGAIVVLARPEAPIAPLSSMGGIARGYLSIDLSPLEFGQAMDLVSKGGVVLSRGIAETLMDNFSINQPYPNGKLSEREQEVLSLLAQGATNGEIAEELIVSENTIKVHVRNILNKLNLRNRQQVAAYVAQKSIKPSQEKNAIMV